MKLDLSEIARTAGAHIVQDFETPCPGNMGFECTSDVKGTIEFSNTGSLLIIGGGFNLEIKLECSRCLIDFTLPIQAEIEEELRLEAVGDSVRLLPLDEQEEFTEVIRNNLLDVDELIRQNLLLVLPIQPLCRPDCEGLCPTCGENLNITRCACPPVEPESPFHVLADLLKEENENG